MADRSYTVPSRGPGVHVGRRTVLAGTARSLSAAALVAGAGALASCGPSPTPAVSTPSTPGPGGVSVPATSGGATGTAPALTGELRVALPSQIISLDPHGAAAVGAAWIGRQIMDTLVVRDPASGGTLPGLAESWQTPDELTWLFRLRRGVTFHNGAPLTATDVKASLERAIALKGTLASLWADVTSVEAPDELTVRIATKAPLGTLLGSLSVLFIGPAAAMNGAGFWEQPVGTGPFRFVSWRKDAELRLEGNAGYWGGPPRLKSLVFREIPEEVARVTALQTGEIHFTRGVSPDQLPALRGDGNLKIDSAPSFVYEFVWMNAKRPPFTDRRVRQALAYALDLDTMVKDLLPGVAARAKAPIPSTVFGFAPQTPFAYDLQKARQLLSEAGYPDGFETSLSWTEGSAGPQGREVVQTMMSYWSKVGARVRSAEVERAQWAQDLVDLKWDMTFLTNTVLTGDADYTLRRLYISSANRTGYANAELDTLLNQAAAEVDQTKRLALYVPAQKIIWDEAVGIFPVELLETYVYRKNVTGVVVNPDQTPRFYRVGIAA